MQKRHTDRRAYFSELAQTAQRHIMPYTDKWKLAAPGMDVLELGCGEGGNLLPYARRGCRVTGVDLCAGRTEQAREFFAEAGAEGRFVCADLAEWNGEGAAFDLILMHDVIEHIADKRAAMEQARRLLRPGGMVFVAFPSWPMPFGGHQQIARSRMVSRLPFVHLLPRRVYWWLLRACGEKKAVVSELMSIRGTRCTAGMFRRVARRSGLAVVDETPWLVNPHYETKFGLRPRRLPPPLRRVPLLRDVLSTSCFFMLRAACPAEVSRP